MVILVFLRVIWKMNIILIYMSDNDKIIEKVYYDPAGYWSINATLKDARSYDSSITYEDVKSWKEKNVERKTQLKGTNSFVASYPRQEYQMDNVF